MGQILIDDIHIEYVPNKSPGLPVDIYGIYC